MHKSMQILMARMDSHPEEFDTTFKQVMVGHVGRWDFVTRPLLMRYQAMVAGEFSFDVAFLTDDEVREVLCKLAAVQGDAFTQRIMNELLQDERTDRVPLQKFGGGMAYAHSSEVMGSIANVAVDYIDHRLARDDSSQETKQN